MGGGRMILLSCGRHTSTHVVSSSSSHAVRGRRATHTERGQDPSSGITIIDCLRFTGCARERPSRRLIVSNGLPVAGFREIRSRNPRAFGHAENSVLSGIMDISVWGLCGRRACSSRPSYPTRVMFSFNERAKGRVCLYDNGGREQKGRISDNNGAPLLLTNDFHNR